MPAKDFLAKFKHDPATFDFDKFKDALTAEIDGDEDLRTAAITDLTEKNTALTKSERDLKVSLFDATIARQGTPVSPTDSPASGAMSNTPVPPIPEADLFG